MNATGAAHAVAYEKLDDERLVELARAGEAVAFRLITQRNNRRLYRVARGILGDDAEAEDVVQETYLRAFENLAGFRSESNLTTWLTRIAINEALGRKRKRRPMLDLKHLDMLDEKGRRACLSFLESLPVAIPRLTQAGPKSAVSWNVLSTSCRRPSVWYS